MMTITIMMMMLTMTITMMMMTVDMVMRSRGFDLPTVQEHVREWEFYLSFIDYCHGNNHHHHNHHNHHNHHLLCICCSGLRFLPWLQDFWTRQCQRLLPLYNYNGGSSFDETSALRWVLFGSSRLLSGRIEVIHHAALWWWQQVHSRYGVIFQYKGRVKK